MGLAFVSPAEGGLSSSFSPKAGICCCWSVARCWLGTAGTRMPPMERGSHPYSVRAFRGALGWGD